MSWNPMNVAAGYAQPIVPPMPYAAPQALSMLAFTASPLRPSGDGMTLKDHRYKYLNLGPLEMRIRKPFEFLKEKLLGLLGRSLEKDGYSAAEVGTIAASGNPLPKSGFADIPNLQGRMPFYGGYGMGGGMPMGGYGMGGMYGMGGAMGGAMGGVPMMGMGGGMPVTGGGVPYSPQMNQMMGGFGGPINAMGGDVDNMVGSYAGNLEGMTNQIEGLMAKGDLNERESRQLQWLMMKRSELSMLISQVMNTAHETRKHIIGNIRS